MAHVAVSEGRGGVGVSELVLHMKWHRFGRKGKKIHALSPMPMRIHVVCLV